MTHGARPHVAISPVGHVAVATVTFRASGQLRVAAVVKASFSVVQDGNMALTEPDPLVPMDVHRENNPAASLVAATDLVPYRMRADVLLTGHARAPEGRTVATTTVRLMVARDRAMLLDKRLVVQGWTDARRRTPAPFATMPLVYELAAGGPQVRENPVGVPERSMRAPNILDGWRRPIPVGFGPLAPAWPVRRALLGPAHEAALGAPIPDLGADFPWVYFNAAPEDQRIDFLRGEEWIGFEGMSPTLPRVQSRLPGLRGVARVYGPAPGLAAGRPVALVADTLLIDADRMRVSVVWRGSFQVASERELASLHIYAGVEAKGCPLAFPEAYRPPCDDNLGHSEEHPLIETVFLGSDRGIHRPAVTPFVPTATGHSTGISAPSAPESKLQPPEEAVPGDLSETFTLSPELAARLRPATPFQAPDRVHPPAAMPLAPTATGHPRSVSVPVSSASENKRQPPGDMELGDLSETSTLSPELAARLRPATPFQATEQVQPTVVATRFPTAMPTSDEGGPMPPRGYRESRPEISMMPLAPAEPPSLPASPSCSLSPATPFVWSTGMPPDPGPRPSPLGVDDPAEVAHETDDIAPPPLMVAPEAAPPTPSTPPGESPSSATLGAAFLRAMAGAKLRSEGRSAR